MYRNVLHVRVSDVRNGKCISHLVEFTVNNAAESAFLGRVGQPICKDFGIQIV